MGLKRDPALVFEDLMNQHLFGNSHIIDPDTRLPWNKQRSIFKVIPDTRLLTIADLYINFKHLDYKLNPCVHLLLQPNLRKANAHFSTRKRHITIELSNWQKLLDSIPASWRNIIALGNQQFNNNEFIRKIRSR